MLETNDVRCKPEIRYNCIPRAWDITQRMGKKIVYGLDDGKAGKDDQDARKESKIAGGNMADSTCLAGEMMVVVRKEGRMG